MPKVKRVTKDHRVLEALKANKASEGVGLTSGELAVICKTNDARKAISNLRADGHAIGDKWIKRKGTRVKLYVLR